MTGLDDGPNFMFVDTVLAVPESKFSMHKMGRSRRMRSQPWLHAGVRFLV